MIYALLVGALILSMLLAEAERRRHADERARLIAAVLHRSPEAAAAIVVSDQTPDRPKPEPRPHPIGL